MKRLPLDWVVPSPLETLSHPLLAEKEIFGFVKRDDKIHPRISGNKYRKLKYNLEFIQNQKFGCLITFGGAFSNHLHAAAAAGNYLGITTVGIVRGEPSSENNPTLSFCREQGMILHFVSREEYRKKEQSPKVQEIINQYKRPFILPEGGSNELALKGISEIWDELAFQLETPPDYIFCACGTGATAAGLLASKPDNSKVMAFSALKSHHLFREILRLCDGKNEDDLLFFEKYHFGGYAKKSDILSNAADTFYAATNISTDLVYNAKAVFGFLDLVSHDYFPKRSTVVWLNTGGIQGNSGFDYLKKQIVGRY